MNARSFQSLSSERKTRRLDRNLARTCAKPAQAASERTAAHTPGPWILRHERNCGKTDHVIKIGSASVYFNRGVGNTEETAIANARLIAAAPETAAQRDELLAVCKGLLDYAKFHLADHQAEFGETPRNAAYHSNINRDIDSARAAIARAEASERRAL